MPARRRGRPTRSERSGPSSSGSPLGPRPGLLSALALLGAANAAWAAFLWRELLVARAGADPFCALGGEGCALLWEGPFAAGVQSLTGVPVAGWGVAWSLVALALPALTRYRAGRGDDPEPLWSATLITAAAGLAAVAGLAGVSLAAATLCGDCLITYAGVGAYAALVGLEAWRTGARRPAGGSALAAGAAAVVFLLVLGPGLRTPAPDTRKTATPPRAAAAPRADSGDLGPAKRRLEERLDALSPRARQALADARALWLASRPPRELEPRAPWGPADAPVLLTVFTDSSCPHCARFHRALESLRRAAPEGSLAIDSRVFPLDGSCNPHVGAGEHPERCLAARLRLCLARDPAAEAFEEALFARIGELSEPVVWEVAERFGSREQLRACVDSERTAERLREDIALAMVTGIRGTPHVLLNGRPIPQNLDFAYAMALAGADAEHPAFDALPAPTVGRSGAAPRNG